MALRPYAKLFLQTLRCHYNLVVFTASTDEYAKAIVDIIDPHQRSIQGILSRNHCYYERGVLIKDIRIISNVSASDIVVLDNSVRSFWFQPNNGIPILSWNGEEDDKELMHIVDYLVTLSTVDDVRTSLKQRFDINNFLFNLY